ncbi:MAG: YIP1 family protein [bacterium]
MPPATPDPRRDALPESDESADAPAREEEDILLAPAQPELAFNWDPLGRFRKIFELFFTPRRLFPQVVMAPDIMTPFLLLTLLGCLYVATVGERTYAMVLPEATKQMVEAQKEMETMGISSELTAEEEAQYPTAMATGYVWMRGVAGFKHLTMAGMYALLFWWLARYLDYKPYDYAQCLSLMGFIWLPKPLYGLLLDFILPFLPTVKTWADLEERRLAWVPGMHLLIPESALHFDRLTDLALFYLVVPLDIFFIWALVLIGLAGPVVLRKSPGTWKLVGVYALLFILISAGFQRLETPPDKLREASQRTRAAEAQ